MEHRRARLAPLTNLRVTRLQAGITLAEAAGHAGLSTFRLSIIERNPSEAHTGEVEAARAAIDAIVAERQPVLPSREGVDDNSTLVAALAKLRREAS